MTFLISYAFIFLAAFFNACMDAWENRPNYNESIFKSWDKNFWCKQESANSVKKIFGYRFDAWHIAKSLMIICFAGAIIFWKPHHQLWVHFITIGIIWNVTFWLFYHKLFRVK